LKGVRIADRFATNTIRQENELPIFRHPGPFDRDHQTEERVENALDTLAAAIDSSEGYLEWEGHERQLTLGKDAGWDQVRWTVHAADGNLLAKSDNLNADELGATGRWRLAHRLVRAHAHASARKGPPSNEKARKHLQLRLTTGISLDSQDATLRNLAGALLGLCAISRVWNRYDMSFSSCRRLLPF